MAASTSDNGASMDDFGGAFGNGATRNGDAGFDDADILNGDATNGANGVAGDITSQTDAAGNPLILGDDARGAQAPADGNAVDPAMRGATHSASGVPLPGASPNGPGGAPELGPNNERLENIAPRLVNALRELVVMYRDEGLVARRHEIRRIRQARLFWQGLQYAWWNPADMNWHLPTDGKAFDDSSLEDQPRYQFVTNLYQAFGLSFVSLISQDVPATRFYPQSTLSEQDISTAKAASEVAALIEQNNHVENLLTGLGFYLWTDGKIGGYVRYVADGQRFGWRDELVLEERFVRLGRDAWHCTQCGAETEVDEDDADDASNDAAADAADGSVAQVLPRANSDVTATHIRRGEPEALGSHSATGSPAASSHNENEKPQVPRANRFAPSGRISRAGEPELQMPNHAAASGEYHGAASGGSNNAPRFLAGSLCPACGAALGHADFRPAPLVPVPISIGTRKVPSGQEVISIIGGLELNTPVWANEQHEFPYLQWQMEVHRAKLKAAYPHVADKIQAGGAESADDIYARATRVAVAQGMPGVQAGDTLFNLVTFSRTWIRPWAFYAIEDAPTRDALLGLFPDGCYVAFAGDTYCESRNECMDDSWRVMHALPGDGQNRPSVGESLIDLQERYNTLSNIQAETYEYGIPPIYADPQVLDFDALSNQTAEPAAHYPARARPGMSLADGFFQPAPAQVPPDMLRHQQDLIGPIAQFLTGLFPAVFGGEMENVKTASGYAMARDQALGRLGLVWRRLKHFYGDVMMLGVECFRKNRPNDVEMPFLGAGGQFEAKFIRLADLKGNIQAHPESDETFPRLKSQQRAVLQQLMSSSDPMIQSALTEPANLGFIKSLIGLSELVVPGEDARNKQLREIQQLLLSGPIVIPARSPRDINAPSPDALPGNANLRIGGVDSAPETKNRQYGDWRSQVTSATHNGSDGSDARSGVTNSPQLVSTVPIDQLLDDHANEFEECRRWASSDAGQIARAQNPAGFANVHAHAAEHAAALAAAVAQQQLSAAMASDTITLPSTEIRKES